MNVLMISGDKNLLTEGSEASARLGLQRSQVDQLDVFVWPQVHSEWEIMRAARKNHYDVVTTQDPFWRGLLGWKIKLWFGAKLNLQVHADLSAQPFWRRALASFLLKKADSVRVVSEKIKDFLVPLHLHAAIFVLPIFVEIRRFRNVTPQQHSQKTILWLGRFEPEKDPLYAIQVLKEVRAKGVDAKLVMLGAGGLEGVLRQAAQNLPISFPGWSDPTSYLETADVVLCTSRHESWGASIVEALAAGVPVVAPDVGIAREAGAIIADRNQLASKVIEVMKDGTRGTLRLNLPSAEEWAKSWRETLA